MHSNARDVGERAEILLKHLGPGNLPADAPWSTTEHAAFADLTHEQLLEPVSAQPVTHLTCHCLPLPETHDLPAHEVKATRVTYAESPGINVRLAGMSWRSHRKRHGSPTAPPSSTRWTLRSRSSCSQPRSDQAVVRTRPEQLATTLPPPFG
ncbi:hypothetical protein [Streptomyces chryseus]